MESLRLIGMSICITMVVTSIFSMLTPNTKLEKVIKFAISLFFLTSIISPFVSGKLNFNIDIEDISYNENQTELSKSVENQFISIAKRNLENSVEKIMINNDIPVKKVEVIINITDNDSISINRMMVYIDSAKTVDENKIKKIAKDEVGITPEIIKR